MPSTSGDRFTVRIGGNVAGPVVVGHDNQVEVNHPNPEAAPAPAPESSTLNTTAEGHATAYSVMNGDLHVHHDSPEPPPTD
ncbi:hypothetical protein [Kitasatospora sp. McL0602]|uniref:hypothetical protein n=1 Tax=Kitasatospora sp. McL0602 TaxID=3439530 RepID=UPI003F88C65F